MKHWYSEDSNGDMLRIKTKRHFKNVLLKNLGTRIYLPFNDKYFLDNVTNEKEIKVEGKSTIARKKKFKACDIFQDNVESPKKYLKFYGMIIFH